MVSGLNSAISPDCTPASIAVMHRIYFREGSIAVLPPLELQQLGSGTFIKPV